VTVIIDQHGQVTLEAHLGSDLDVVNAARVSFGKRSNELDEAGEKLIGYLMRERHGTPFEHNLLRFHVACPIFVAREWFRHRIGSFNEMSARYTELPDRWWAPTRFDLRRRVGKPGRYTYEPFLDAEGEESTLGAQAAHRIDRHGRDSFTLYQQLLKAGVAPEQARAVLPVSTYTEFWWSVNARSLMNFLSLRTAPEAQAEIRAYAVAVEQLWATTMPVTHRAWVENGRVTP
jgi:thymidylate synthase (FAD)